MKLGSGNSYDYDLQLIMGMMGNIQLSDKQKVIKN